jgi:hypothetical protein
MKWWRDITLRAAAVCVAAGVALTLFMAGLWIWHWPR